MPKKELVAVLGAGNMGTALAQVAALNGYRVNLWNYGGDPEPLRQIKEKRENLKYLPGVKLAENIIPQENIRRAVAEADVIFVSVPSKFIKSVAAGAAQYISRRAVCVDVSKGLDEKTFSLTTDILKNILPKNKIVTISGPAVAGQMARGGFTAMNAASADAAALRLVKKVLENKNLKLFFTTDIAGVETAGSFKNVYAIAIGVCDGLKMPTNTKAILFTAALREMGLVVKKMGGRLETVYGLAGLGDLIGTGLADVSRNRRLGEWLGKGFGLKKSLAKVGQTAEGVSASEVLNKLARKHKLKTPLADAIYKIIRGQINPRTGMDNFLKNLR